MRKYVALLFLTLITSSSYGQNNYQEVVYFKNGRIIRGTIIEQVPNKSIKIETADKNVFVFPLDEVEKITKETTTENKQIKNKSVRRKGYIGLSIGPSFPVGDFASYGYAKTGIHINLINFGYRFSENVGLSATWFGAANPLDVPGYSPWSYGGLMAGPLLSFPLSEKLEWDFRPMIGFSSAMLPDSKLGTERAASFAFNFGTVLRINVGNKVAVLWSADYYSTKARFENYIGNNIPYEQNIGTISFGFGVAYRLK